MAIRTPLIRLQTPESPAEICRRISGVRGGAPADVAGSLDLSKRDQNSTPTPKVRARAPGSRRRGEITATANAIDLKTVSSSSEVQPWTPPRNKVILTTSMKQGTISRSTVGRLARRSNMSRAELFQPPPRPRSMGSAPNIARCRRHPEPAVDRLLGQSGPLDERMGLEHKRLGMRLSTPVHRMIGSSSTVSASRRRSAALDAGAEHGDIGSRALEGHVSRPAAHRTPVIASIEDKESASTLAPRPVKEDKVPWCGSRGPMTISGGGT